MRATHEMFAWPFWGAVCLTLYTYAGYPMWMYARSRVHPRPFLRHSVLPKISIILAVRNGETLLRQKIKHLLSLDYPRKRLEIVIVSDGSTDGTDEILKACHYPPIRYIRLSNPSGKAVALNEGMKHARGDIVLFFDIRPWIERDGLKLLLENFADPEVGCAAGEVVLCESGHELAAKAVGGLYWRYEQWIRNCEARVDSPVGVYGGFYAVRRELVSDLPPGTILDDMFQPLSVIRQGFRSVLDSRVRVYDVWPKNLRGEFQRKVRTLAGNFQLIQLAPWLLSGQNRLRFQLISHKLLRLLVPYLLAIALVSSGMLSPHSLFFSAIFIAQVLFYILAALGIWQGIPWLARIAAPASAFCMLNAAAVAGFYQFLFCRDELWKIWTPTAPVPVKSDEASSSARSASPVWNPGN
jgi:glycosyltransferase involved in cell wall biosynthesis